MASPNALNNLISYVEALEKEIIESLERETGLPIRTGWRELGCHLANLKLMVSYRYEDPARKKQSIERQDALSNFQKLVRSLSDKLETLLDPESPLSCALDEAAFLAIAPMSATLAEIVEFVDSETSKSADRQLREDIAFLKVALDRISKYNHRAASERSPKRRKSVAQWNIFYVGEVLPALYEHHFGRNFGIQRDPNDDNKLGGHGVGFLSAAAKALGILGPDGAPYSSETLVGYYKQAKRDPQEHQEWVRNAKHDW
ncbi:hypothetical protein [Microvirga ossetica]|nr:hypothetical protein [Microvirga ossetica]